jgi:pimeloyl-ACP methyl ester carboxylesterase
MRSSVDAQPGRDRPETSGLRLLDDPRPAGGEREAGGPDGGQVLSHRIRLHGHRMHYLETGRPSDRPPVVLLHGLAGEAASWIELPRLLGRHAHVLALDMLGCGESDKPRGADYSVGAHAARLRDLLRELRLGRASVVGHSFGGGVAMSFAYQFPERTDRVALIASGGLGDELGLGLRAASLPGAVWTAKAVTWCAAGWLRRLAGHAAVELGVASRADLDALGRAWDRLDAPGARDAFVATLRGAVGWSGQRLTATDRLGLFAELPILLIAGSRDSFIPHHHSLRAHRGLPCSRLEILDTGHFPHHEHPRIVADLLTKFLTGTEGDGATPFPHPATRRRTRTAPSRNPHATAG